MESPLITDPLAQSAWQRANKITLARTDRKVEATELASQIGDYRLDWLEAIIFSLDLNDAFDSKRHRHEDGGVMTFRQVARLENPGGFSLIQNVGVAARAWEIIRRGDKL